jgi:hypothetical protein
VRPRIVKIKREFLFQFYENSQKLAKGLSAKAAKPYVHEVEAIIKKTESKIKL